MRGQSHRIGSPPLHVGRVLTYPTHYTYYTHYTHYTHVRVLPAHTDRLLFEGNESLKKLDAEAKKKQIQDSHIVKAMIGLFTLGKTHFADISADMHQSLRILADMSYARNYVREVSTVKKMQWNF